MISIKVGSFVECTNCNNIFVERLIVFDREGGEIVDHVDNILGACPFCKDNDSFFDLWHKAPFCITRDFSKEVSHK